MKKTLLKTTAVALCLTAITFSAKADEAKRLQDGFFFQPYMGLGYSRTNSDFKTIDGIDYGNIFANDYNSLNVFAGSRIHKHIGFELGYSHSDEQTGWAGSGAGWSGKVESKFKTFSFDALGYYALPQNQNIELIGSIGIGRYKAESKATLTAGTLDASYKDNISKTALRLGLGGQYFLKENLSLKAMYRYANIDKDCIDSINEYSLGIAYHF